MLRVKVYHVFIGAMTFPHVLVFAYNYLGNGRLTTISLKVAAISKHMVRIVGELFIFINHPKHVFAYGHGETCLHSFRSFYPEYFKAENYYSTR
jgi:hypothetical protein